MFVGTATAGDRNDSRRHSTDVLRFFTNHSWLVAPNKPKCSDVPWQKSCRIGRALVQKHERNLIRLDRTIPSTDNWTRAMRYAQRVYPGTYWWLQAISNRECRACYTVSGGFVCNYEGSGACGPLQFKSGTFYTHAFGTAYGAGIGAKYDVAKRGFKVHPSTWTWSNPLGQALTGAYMKATGISGCHWCLPGDSLR